MLSTTPLANADSTSRKNERDNGSVLLSFDGRIIKLNWVGTLIWEILYSNRRTRGLTEAELLRLLTKRTQSLVEGPITQEKIGKDLHQFLCALVERRLILASTGTTGPTAYRRANDIVWSGQHDPLRLQIAGDRSPIPSTIIEKPNQLQINRRRLMTLRALFWLLSYTFLIRIGGFRRIRQIVHCHPRKSKKTYDKNSEKEICRQICTAVDRAQTYLLRQALCLQRSIVITRLLQEHNIGAETVIAAHLMPFKSHAWVEVEGEVVSDSPNVQRYYDVVIERLGVIPVRRDVMTMIPGR